MLFTLAILLSQATASASPDPISPHIAPTDQDAVVIGESRRVEMPAEIASALLPYMKCLTERLNESAAQGISSGDEFRAAQSAAVEACLQARTLAQSEARKLLATTEKSKAEQNLLIESWLTSVEHMQDDVADQLDALHKEHSHAED